MLVYTIQSLAFWQSKQDTPYPTPQAAFIEPDWKTAYQWMQDQYQRQFMPLSSPLIWVWKTCPDDWETHLSPGIEGVLLVLEVPESQVLWSHFEAWHYVLNHWQLSEEEDPLFPIEKTWERVFDFEFCATFFEESIDEMELQGVIAPVLVEKATCLATTAASSL